MSSINVIIRPVSKSCNLACSYCYTKLEPELKKESSMTKEVLEECIEQFIVSGHQHIKFLWHGGEPLLAGLNFFKRALRIQAKFHKKIENKVAMTNSLQTNGVLLNEKIVEFLKLNKFQVGLSIDGFAEIHNANRRTKYGAGSHKAVINGIDLLQKYKVNFGVVVVVTKKSLEYSQEILSFFINRKIFNIHFLPFAETDRKNGGIDLYSITAEEYGDFLKEIFHYWRTMDNPLIKIRIIDNFLQGLIGGKIELCTFSRSCQSHILIETNGNLYICGRNANNPNFFVGNISKISLQNILKSNGFEVISNRLNEITGECRNCDYVNICKGGCGYFKLLLSKGGELNKDYFCASYKVLAELITNWLKSENMPIKC